MRSIWQKYLRDTSGTSAVMFGLSIFAVLAAVGGAVDFSLMSTQKHVSQDALDEAALAIATSSLTNPDDLKNLAIKVFAQNISGKGLNVQISDYAADSNTRTFHLAASGTYTPYLLQLVGFKTIPYSVTADTTKAADGTLEVALVLDNTWSMSQPLDGTQSKIQVLKTAAQNLVNTIMTPANKPYVKVAVVPYADYVNVGLTNRNQSWLSVPADYSTTSTKTCTTSTTKTVCTGGTLGTCNGTQDGVPYTYSCWIVPQACSTQTVAPYQTCSGGGTTNYKWFGCVKNQMTSGSLTLPDPITPYAGIMQTSQTCLSTIQPLSNDSAAVLSSINGLVVSIGSYKPETYIPGGLTWGVNILSPQAPFVEGGAYDPKNKQPRKTLVLMTDGANTLYSTSSGSVAVASSSQLTTTYADEIKACNYAKSKNIEIYTIGFGVTDANGLKNLQNCATDSAHYFDAKSSADLIAAFHTIGGKLSKVRIVQ
ncbi:MAG: pilus assembly protein TadG-related protein [Asticcacaulis sp.]